MTPKQWYDLGDAVVQVRIPNETYYPNYDLKTGRKRSWILEERLQRSRRRWESDIL